MKRNLRGNMTIEAVVIVPLILMVIAVVISIMFYYHDKTVIKGVAHETAMVFSDKKEATCEEVEEYFQKHLRRKLLVFSNVEAEITLEDKIIQITCSASRRFMRVLIETKVQRTEPEVWIRRIRLAEKIGNQLGEKE